MHACGAACSCIFGLLRHSHPPPMSVTPMLGGCRQLAASSQGGTPVSHTKITAGPPTQNGYGDTPLRLHPCLQHHPSPYAPHRKLAHFLPLQSGGASPLANTPASWNRISKMHPVPALPSQSGNKYSSYVLIRVWAYHHHQAEERTGSRRIKKGRGVGP